MVIIDSEDSKSPRGPRPAPQVLAPPPYAPLSPRGSSPLPPPRSPGARAPPSPFSAPASNYLTIKREKADITGSWNINTTLPAPQLGRSFSLGSDRDSEDTASEANTDFSGSSATSASIQSTPNLKLFSPRGKIDAAIRVSGSSRAWIEAVSRDEDVALTFPPNPSGAARPPIRLLVRSTAGHVQVNLPYPFMGTLRVPSDTVLPPSLRSQSVVLAPSEPPIDRPPILDEPTKPRFGSLPSRSTTPTPPSPPQRAATSEAQTQSGTPSPPLILENVPTIETPMTEVSPTTKSDVEPEPIVTVTAPEGTTTEPTVRLPEPAPAPEVSMEEVGRTSPPVEHPTPLSPPLSPPLEIPSGPNTSTSVLVPNLPPRSPSRASHHRSPSASSHKPPSVLHNRTGSLPGPAPQHDSSEASTVYFIGDYLRSNYTAENWTGDEFVIDSECGRVRVCWYGEKADVTWTEDVTSKVKDAMDWKSWKSPKGLKDMAVAMPKMSVGGLGRRFGFK